MHREERRKPYDRDTHQDPARSNLRMENGTKSPELVHEMAKTVPRFIFTGPNRGAVEPCFFSIWW